MTNKTYAAIDLGSNSCRLFICDETGHELYSEHYSTRLAEGMYANGCLTDDAFERGREAFFKIQNILKKYHVLPHNLRAITTAACRTARNGQQFINEMEEVSGIRLEIIDGTEEAELNLQGASEHVKGKSKYVIIWDIGGGSTEITLAHNTTPPQIIKTVSIPYGARNAAEKFALSEYNSANAADLQNEIDIWMDNFFTELAMPPVKDISFVATSSTALRLVAMIEKQPQYNRENEDGHIITRKALNDIINNLCTQSVAAMAQNPCIGVTRAPIFLAAAIIFAKIVQRLNADNIVASLKSAKDAIIANLIERDRKKW